MNNFCEQILDILKNYVRKYHNNNVRQAAQALGLSEPTLAQWLKGTRSPNLESIGPVLDRIGVSVVLCNTTARDVQLVPVCTDAAGRGLVPEDGCIAIPQLEEFCKRDRNHVYGDVKDWFYLRCDHPVVRTRKNLVAVRITRDELEPEYNAGDILVVDLDDRQPDNGCSIFSITIYQ